MKHKRESQVRIFGICFIALLVLASCAEKNERKIKLAARPITALMQDEVETIQIAAAQKKKIALLEFQPATAARIPGWLQNGIKQSLSKSLAQSQQLNLGPSRFVSDALVTLGLSESDLENENVSQRLAEALNADVLIRGRFYFDNETLHVDVQVRQREDGTIVRRFSSASSDPDTMSALNNIMNTLSLELRSQLEDRYEAPPEIETVAADVSTSSKEAYKLYIEGLEKLEQFYLPEALPLFAKAVVLDTTFAAAYHALATTMIGLGLGDEAHRMLDKAEKYAEHLSDREKLPILAMQALFKGELYKAVSLYNHMIQLYPEDDGAHYELGNYYFGVAQNPEKAVEKYETTIELNPKHKLAHNQLAYAYASIGELEHAFYILDKYVQLAPNQPNPFDSYGEILQHEGHLNEAVEMYKKALHIKPDFWMSQKHLVTAYQDLGRTDKAGRLLQAMTADTLNFKYRAELARILAFNEILAGDLEKAETHLRFAAHKDPKALIHKLNLLYIKPESEEYQQNFLAEIGQQVEMAHKDSLKNEKLLVIVSWALYFNLGLDLVDDLLNISINSGSDPILRQSAIAYKTILSVLARHDPAETQKLFERHSDPATFQYAGPASWNSYWRHYFKALYVANSNDTFVQEWAKGFYEFARASGNSHYAINGTIALAAAEYFSGDATGAEQIMNEVGFPCEGDWKVVGPFELKRGFHQKFWPEKVSVEKWTSQDKYSRAIFQKRDDLFDGYVDLKQIAAPTLNSAVYALLEINSKNFKQVQLCFGINGRLKVWLNDEAVMMKNARGEAIIDRYTANAKLQIGTNYLLVRLDSAIGEMGFYFRLTDINGKSERDIEFHSPTLLAHVLGLGG